MNLILPADIQKLIDERVDSGKYQTPEEVVAAAITQLDQQESVGKLAASELELLYPGIKEKLAEGLAAARASRFVDGEVLFEALEKEDADTSS
jgi:Arc/MetJ-type ribon-helix-helix transcriptional regulator